MDVISNRAYVFYQQKEFEKAISDCKLYLQLKPKDTEVINLNGLCYAGLNDFDTAILEYNKAIQIEPANGLFISTGRLRSTQKEIKPQP
ncbi:MAG: hypothetical protein IPF54_16825 [Draconibacterium sp.]|nr:hypothetical protein [Draconibacterium sp.]